MAWAGGGGWEGCLLWHNAAMASTFLRWLQSLVMSSSTLLEWWPGAWTIAAGSKLKTCVDLKWHLFNFLYSNAWNKVAVSVQNCMPTLIISEVQRISTVHSKQTYCMHGIPGWPTSWDFKSSLKIIRFNYKIIMSGHWNMQHYNIVDCFINQFHILLNTVCSQQHASISLRT